MNILIDYIAVAILLINLIMLSSSRIRTCIRAVAIQGVLIACIPLISRYPILEISNATLTFLNIFIKGVVFPFFLFKALQEANIRKEIEPYGGFSLSMVAGLFIFVMSFILSNRLPCPEPYTLTLGVSVSFATFFTGAFIIVSRVKAITQVIGYLMLENGIYFFGVAFLNEQSLLVELAILLDVFVAIFVMGITIFHINREFDHIDTQKLSELKDLITEKQEL